MKEWLFKKGDLVLVVRRSMLVSHKSKGKFQPKWEGLFVVESLYSNEAYKLANPDGQVMMAPINSKFLKKYYP